MPLRQPPAEQPFSLIPPNWNPVSNDRVLPHLGLLFCSLFRTTSIKAIINFSPPVRLELPRPITIEHH